MNKTIFIMVLVIFVHLETVQSRGGRGRSSGRARGNSNGGPDYHFGIMRKSPYEKEEKVYTSVQNIENDLKLMLDELENIKNSSRYEFVHEFKGLQDLIAKEYKDNPEL